MDIGTNGRASDGGVWAASALKFGIEDGSLNLPETSQLPSSNRTTPYVILADDAFLLKTYIKKPYSFRNQDDMQRIFSYRLSRARRTVENAFGIIASRFRVLFSPMNLNPTKVEKIVLACTVLHNFLWRRLQTHMAKLKTDSLPRATTVPSERESWKSQQWGKSDTEFFHRIF